MSRFSGGPQGRGAARRAKAQRREDAARRDAAVPARRLAALAARVTVREEAAS